MRVRACVQACACVYVCTCVRACVRACEGQGGAGACLYAREKARGAEGVGRGLRVSERAAEGGKGHTIQAEDILLGHLD
eukprot:613653-Pleurochrysis_carterae.AAC.3